MIHIQLKSHEVLVIGYLVMANYQFNGYISCITEAILTKSDMHQRIMAVYILF